MAVGTIDDPRAGVATGAAARRGEHFRVLRGSEEAMIVIT